jgi:hypothetical protein
VHHLAREKTVLEGEIDHDAGTLAHILARHHPAELGNAERLTDAQPLAPALDVDVHRLAGMDEVAAVHVSGLAHQHLAAQAERLDAGGEIDLLADHGIGAVSIRSDEPGHDPTGADPDTDIDLWQLVLAMPMPELVHRDLHFHGAQQRALGMVSRRGVIAMKDHHDGIAHELIDGAVMPHDDLGHQPEAAAQHAEDHVGRIGSRDRREPAQVGEEDARLAL